MIIENDKVLLVDLTDVKSAAFAGSCASCGGEDSAFARKMAALKYINVSTANTSKFKSWAKADFDNNKIKPGTVKVYPCRGSDKPPVFKSNTLEQVKADITDFYNAFRSTDTPLDKDLAQKMALAIKEYYVFGDTKKKCEEAMYNDFPTKIYQSKAFGPILERWVNLRLKINCYREEWSEPYIPDINITCKPYIAMCPDGSKTIINVVKKDGKTETYCKSALIIINRSTDFGYRINGITDLGDMENTAFAQWDSYLSSKQTEYSREIYARMINALNGPLPNQMIRYAPGGDNGEEPVFQFKLSTSRTQVFNIQVTVPIGSGPEFGENWFYSPRFEVQVSPVAIGSMIQQYIALMNARRQAAEQARNANRNAIATPNPATSTPPTTIDYNVDNPVVTPPTSPVDKSITDPVANAITDGKFGGNSGAFDLDNM